MPGIRVTYSGLASFAAGTMTLVLGLAFTLVIARGLPIEEYGAWGAIWVLLTYALLLDPVVSYWATRDAARGLAVARTAVASSAALSGAATVAYVAMAYALAPAGGVDAGILALAAVIVPSEMVRRALASITLTHRPHGVEYALLAGSAAKTALALGLVMGLSMGIDGVIAAALAGSALNAAILAAMSRSRLAGSLEPSRIRRWLRLSWIPAWRNLVPLLSKSDIVVFTVITGSLVGVAYWIAARTIALIAAHAERVNTALYPSLLAGGARDGLRENLALVLYMVFPLAAMASALAEPALRALGPSYAAAAPAVPILAALVSMRMVTNVLARALTGIEDVDAGDATAVEHARSRLFSIPSLIVMQRGAYLVALAIMLVALVPLGIDEPTLVVYWAALALAMQVPHFAHVCVIARGEFSLVRARRAAVHALCAAASFGAVYAVSGQLLYGLDGALDLAPRIMALALIGIGAYGALTYAADSRTRALVGAVVRELGAGRR